MRNVNYQIAFNEIIGGERKLWEGIENIWGFVFALSLSLSLSIQPHEFH